MSHHHATPARRCCTPAARRRHPRRFTVAPVRCRLGCATTHPQRVAGNSNTFLMPRMGFSSPPPATPLKRPFTTTTTPSAPGCEHWRSAVRRLTWRKSRSECAASCRTCYIWSAAASLAGAVCRHCRSCAFQVYPADAAPVLLSATGAIS
ncbi:hypothetical protein VPH35_135512 [Triticum aestivum]